MYKNEVNTSDIQSDTLFVDDKKEFYSANEVKQLIATKRTYYSVLPAEVRYSKKITANAKLMYSEVTALTNEKGYCWASNNYFAELYGVTPQAISRWIKELEKQGFVKIQYIYKGKEISERRVAINIDTVSIDILRGTNKGLKGYQQIVEGNIKFNTKDNITIREKYFIKEVNSLTEYSETIRKNFIDHWTEPNSSKTKMRFELEKTFDISRRLKRWEDNAKKWNKESSHIITSNTSSFNPIEVNQ